MANLLVIVYVVCAGMPYAAGTNYRPFAPFGAHGVFTAASIVFFSFIGFDTIATTAEEVRAAALRPAVSPTSPLGGLWRAQAADSVQGSERAEQICSTEAHSLRPQAPS